ncbi:MAG: cytochrome c [Chitinophagaceae bacterium]|nr:cytochrome c [Chitinophagaceae bacterium]
MKKVAVMLLGITVFSLYSCSKKEPVVEFTNTTMRTWFDTYCKSCHQSGGSASKDWKYDAADFNNTIKKYIGDIKKEVADKKSMPEGQTLSASELQKFVDWYNAGYPVN